MGIEENNNIATLVFREELLNHIRTLHAGVLFTLAETASGKYLEKTFPKYKGEVSLFCFNIDSC